MKLDSAKYPKPCYINGSANDYLINETSYGAFQVVRERKGGDPQERDFDLLFVGGARQCVLFICDAVNGNLPTRER